MSTKTSARRARPRSKNAITYKAFDARVREYATFYRTHGRNPSSGAMSHSERTIGYFLVKCRARLRDGALTPEQVALLDSAGTWQIPRPKSDDDWDEKFQIVAEFLLTHDRLPIAGEGEHETTLSHWLMAQRKRNNEGRLSDERLAYLDLLGVPASGWLDADRQRRREAAWFARLDEVKNWIAVHGCLPSSYAEDDEERSLRVWLIHQRKQRDSLPEDRQAALEDPVLLEAPSPAQAPADAAWFSRLDEVVEFLRVNGRPPTHASSETEEKRVGQWLAKQRVSLRRERLTPNRAERLEKVLAEIESDPLAAVAQRSLREHIARVGEFHRTHDRLPVGTEPDARWLHMTRTRYRKGLLSPEADRLLRSIDSDWDRAERAGIRPTGPRHDPVDFTESVGLIAEFRATHHRLPRANGGGEATERRLGGMLTRLRAKAKDGSLGDSERRLLDFALPGWLSPRAEKFARTVESIAEFRATHHRLPRSVGADDDAEAHLGGFLSRSRSSARHGDLPDDYRRILDTRVPGWLTENNRFTLFLNNAKRTAKAVNDKGRLDLNGGDRGLYEWSRRTKTRAAEGTLSPDEMAVVKEHTPWLLDA